VPVLFNSNNFSKNLFYNSNFTDEEAEEKRKMPE